MNLARTDAPVVAVGTLPLAVAVGAELTVRGCNTLMPFDPVLTVLGASHPSGRQQQARGEAGLEQSVTLTQVAGRTGAARGSRWMRREACARVATKTTGHSGELIAGSQPNIGHRSVALTAGDASGRVQGVAELQIGRVEVDSFDAGRARIRQSTRVTQRTGAGPAGRIVSDTQRIAMVRAVATVAAHTRGQQPITTLGAPGSLVVANRAADSQTADVLFVTEVERQGLRRKDRQARAAVFNPSRARA